MLHLQETRSHKSKGTFYSYKVLGDIKIVIQDLSNKINMHEIKMKRSREVLESLVTQKPRISKMSIEHEEQIKDKRVNELVSEENLMEELQPNDQELTNDFGELFEIEEIVNEVVILAD